MAIAAVVALFLYGVYIRWNKGNSPRISFIREPVSSVYPISNPMDENVRTNPLFAFHRNSNQEKNNQAYAPSSRRDAELTGAN